MKYAVNLLILSIWLYSSVFVSPLFSAGNARLFFAASSSQIKEGERITVNIKAGSPSQAINAVSGAVSFPENLLRVVSVSKDKSIINLWTVEPSVSGNKIRFEGIILNPGFQGGEGTVLGITFEGKRSGSVSLNFTEGSILANDGQGSNILGSLGSNKFVISPGDGMPSFPVVAVDGAEENIPGRKLLALPVITDYSPSVESKDGFYLKGKGEPNALTKIVFRDLSVKTVGEQLIAATQSKRKKLGEILVKNDSSGVFEYVSSKDLVAGVYNATPFLVDEATNTEKPGLGVQLLVDDSKIVKGLVLLLNVLALFIPIVTLAVIIYFIPWYSWRRMRVMKKKLGLEEEKILLSGHQLERQDKILDQNMGKAANENLPAGQL